MSAISLKSITGITSITTPAGVDNVFTVHTNDTTERFKIDEAGNVRVGNTFDCVGVSTFRNNLFAQSDLRISGEIVHLSDDDTRMQFPSNDTIAFKTAGSERLRIHSGGTVTIYRDLDVDGHTNLDNVSISGVTTITGALHADGFSTVGGEIAINGTVPRIGFTDSNANSDFRIKVDGGSFQIEDITNSSADRFTINSLGAVMVGGTLQAQVMVD